MTGPYPLPPQFGTHGPPRHAAHTGPHPVGYAGPTTGPLPVPPPGYQGPPPLPYPPRRSPWPLAIAVTVTVAVIAALGAATVFAVRDTAAPLTDTAAQSAIQGYLDALADRDIDVVARNTLCGTYDAVSDRRSDEALAKLSSDAFRKQFDTAEVTSIDKIVLLSDYQAQVLFSMRVTLAVGGDPRDGVQGTAQLLMQDDQILVCSYVLRTGGAY
ncbi:Rv0361 family membrane protein [Mycolicibacillus trivialis]|uniref:DUF8174 domain-containing protein n=1 Tax=Mycolicibacillus trivialis TaxID=1798 RepID=A0A1X2EIY4_9MYCO|nr:hypothetical protein [Mycolicibacillus trivialis]ORX03429.1 hypothetical protein AWC30_11130 [Mycolicibacillus trivialis]